MATFVEFKLLDPDLQTVHGILPFQKGDLYLQLNEPGSGSVKTALDIASAALVESGGFIEGHYRAALRGGFFIENMGEGDVNSGEEAGRALEISGRGALALLEDAVVWTDGSGANKRTFSGTQAAMLIELIEEAQTRGGLGIVDWDFDATEDSDGEAWTDDFPLELTVGTSLLDVIRQIAKTGIDFDMLPDGSGNYVLSAYKLGIGSDKSETVYFRVGVNCTEVSHSEAGGGIRNALLVKYKNGYTATQDAASITARRRRESALNYDFVQRPDSAVTFASAELQAKKDPKRQISVKLYDGAGPRAFVDYVLGDTITLDRRGVEEEYRVRGIHLSWVDNGYAEVIVDLNSMILENEIRVTQDLDWLLNEWKTAHDAGLLEVKFWAAIGIPGTALGSVGMKVVGDFLYLINGAKLWKYDLVNGGWTTLLIHSSNLVAIDAIGSTVYVCTTSRVYEVDGSTLVDIGLFYHPSGVQLKLIVAVGTKLYAIGTYDDVTHNASTVTSELTYYQSTDDTWYDTGGVNGYNGATDGTNLYVAGTDTGVSGRLRKWDGVTWTNVGGTFPLTISAVHATATKVIIGVTETGVDNKLYILNGSTWDVLGGGVNGTVRAIATYFDDVYVGGEFTDRGNYVAKYSGEQWWDMAGGTNGAVNLIQMYNDDVIVDGSFTQAGDKTALNVAMYFNSFEALANYLEHSSDSGFNLGEAIHNATAKTPLVAADEMPLWDSITQQLRKITWANILLSIRSWLDSILSIQAIYTYTTSGTSTAFTVTTLASSTALTTNERFFVSFHVTAGAAPTLNRDSKGAKDLKYYDSTGAKAACGATTIISGMRSEVIYDGTDYVLLDLIPVGGGGGTPGGSDTEVQFNDAGVFAGDAEFTFDSTTKLLQVGPAATGIRLYGAEGDIGQYAPDDENPSHNQHAWGAGVPAVIAHVANGTLASQTAIQAAKVLWQVIANAYNGTDFKYAGRIKAVATENHNGTSSGAKWEVYCTPNGTNTEVLVATFDQDGNIDIAAGKEYRVNGAQHQHAGGDITSGTIPLARLPEPILQVVKNTSGATVNEGDVGYINEAGEFKTTTTANFASSWVVVLVGGANNADIYVTRRGRVNVNYTGTAPSAGHFLVTSTSAGLAQRSTVMRPEIFAVCLAAGSGGVVSVRLLTQSQKVDLYSSNNFWRNNAHSTTLFTGTINGVPTATSVVYTVSTGNEDIFAVLGTSELAKTMLYNSTRGTYRLITACNTGTNTLTTVSTTDAWANGDTITVLYQTINDTTAGQTFIGLSLASQSEIPILARSVILQGGVQDTGGAGRTLLFHPNEAYSIPKILSVQNTQSTQQNIFHNSMPLIDRILGMKTVTAGAGTALTVIKLAGYYLAAP